MKKDYYEILGVEKSASKDAIKKAFRTLAHQYHPDKKGGDEKKFKEINEAYQVLSNDKKRAEYDSYGRVFNDGGGANPFGGAGGFSGFEGFQNANFDFGDINDIFNEFFTGGGQRRAGKRGSDIAIDVTLSFEDAVFGVERNIILTKTSPCAVCKGAGAEPGTATKTCASCNGQGKFHDTRRSFFGVFTSVRECDTCSGSGVIPEKKCSSCHGHGVLKKEEEITINIPAGIQNGEMIRLTGRGEAVPRGTSGDLYIKVHVTPHTLFRRDGANLVMDLNVKLTDALLGATYPIKTLDGEIKLTVPPGVTFGEVLRVRGKGIPRDEHGRQRGDLLINIKVQMPKKVSGKAEKLIADLKKEGL
ncbi:MAG: molecular chaperone DnaJ [Parcubacteria group bacterium]|nr:molecular chaperone DnaJ [Parcubacteria group bacterium]